MHRIDDGGCLVPAVHHALRALLVVPGAVGVPVRLLQQLLERFRVTLAEQIAGALPAEIVAGRIAPRRAAIGLIAGQEIEKKARLIERPALAVLPPENVAEQFLGAAAAEEMRLIGGTLIGVSRRDGDPVDAHLGHCIEEPRDPLRHGGVEQRRIDVDAKAPRLRKPDRLYCSVIDAILANRPVVVFLVTVKMNRPGKERVRLELVDLLLEQQRVRAQVDEFLASEDALNDLVDLAVQEWLAAGNDNDRCAAFVYCFEALGDAQALIEDRIGVVDLATSGTG